MYLRARCDFHFLIQNFNSASFRLHTISPQEVFLLYNNGTFTALAAVLVILDVIIWTTYIFTVTKVFLSYHQNPVTLSNYVRP
jgi:hypothetical protein